MNTHLGRDSILSAGTRIHKPLSLRIGAVVAAAVADALANRK